MKLPLARPIARPALSRPAAPVVVPRPSPKPAAKPAAASPKPPKKGTVPPAIQLAALEAETNRILQNQAKRVYDSRRAEISVWMKETGTMVFNASGEVNGEEKTVLVTYENTANEVLDIAKLLKATGLTIAQVYALGILSTSKKAVTDAIGANAATAACVAGAPNYQAKLKTI